MNPKKPFVVTAPLVIIALVAIISVGVYLVYALVIGSQPIESNSTDSTTSATIDTSDWQTYTGGDNGDYNGKYDFFSFQYPKNWTTFLGGIDSADTERAFSFIINKNTYRKLFRFAVSPPSSPRDLKLGPNEETTLYVYLPPITSENFINSLRDNDNLHITTDKIGESNVVRIDVNYKRLIFNKKRSFIYFNQETKEGILIRYNPEYVTHQQILSTFKFTD